MKKIILIIMLSVASSLCSQTCQQTYMELDAEIPKDENLLCEASTSIKMLPGFHCNPQEGHSAMFSINRFGVFPPDEGLIGGPATSNKDGVVGALPGQLNVSDLGAAVYSIPIMMPPGIGNMTPQIAVTYNNQAGNGLLGWGWNLSGLSSITRTGQTVYHDDNQSVVNFTDDRFVLDGKRLMLCSGTYGGNGSVYKTEIDEMSKIVAFTEGYNGPARFVVHKSDGTVWEYGGTTDSRVEPQNLNNTALMWHVNKITDPDGNSIIFNYLENHGTGESYVESIDYTLNDRAGLTSMYRVSFIYDDRLDEESFYVYGNVVQIKKILKKITIKNMVSGDILYDYSFTYLEPGSYSNDYKSMYYRLKSIGLSANGMKLNPTIISWNKSSHYPDKLLSYPLSQNVFNKVPFVGDFNGDGLSDVITVPYKLSNTYPSNVQASVYINKGGGIFDANAFYSFSFDKTLEWVYVVDFDGDGRDDVVPYYADYSENSSWKSKICVYLNKGNTFSYLGEYSSSRFFTVYPGDFLGNRRVGFFLEHNNDGYYSTYYPRYVYYENNSLLTQTLGVESYTFVPERVFVEDVNGDGCSEIMYLMENTSVTAKIIKRNGLYVFYHLRADDIFDSDDFLFPGDFNGDGYTDLLKYDNRTYWKIAFSTGRGFTTPISCMDNNLLRGVTLAPVDRYYCSLKALSSPSVTIRTVDFDGDGKTDVGVFKNTGGNYRLEVGFQPRKNAENSCEFSDIRYFYTNINNSHQYIHIGNFLGHENASILGSVRNNPVSSEIPKIVSLNPHSSKYSVERITDGMGATHGFKYEYLIPDDDFYNYEYQCVSDDLRTVALPVRALAADTVYLNDKPFVTQYSYGNAFYHTKGRGLLGFETSERKLLINNMMRERSVLEKDFDMMDDSYVLLPEMLTKYNNNNQVISSEQYHYDRYICSHNDKVIMPLMTTKKSVLYDSGASGSILKTNIQNIDYQSDMSGGLYSDIVNISRSVDGVDGSYLGDDAASCSYWATNDFSYDNNLSQWVVSRLSTVRKSMHYDDNDEVGECEIMEYSGANPYQVTKRTVLPNTSMNYADPLKIVAEYSYDELGHVIQQSLTSPSERNQRVTRTDYGKEYNYRFPTSKINENGWAVNVLYDNDYGNVLSTVDYNQFATEIEADPFEITKEMVLPDGTKNVKARRWADGNKNAPADASYYTWEKTSGYAEKMSFYNKNGQLLRDVTVGINGEAIYVDMQYDDRGNMASKSMPYIAGDEVKRYFYLYDNDNRLVEEVYPNGLVKDYSYNGLQKTISTVSPDGVSHVVVETYNPMGWRVQVVDIGGNVIDYEYYSDGKLKNTLIGGSPLTKVEYEYDGRRNLSKMKDPSSGETHYEYNAYGELKMKKTAKNCVTTYEYDDRGEMVQRRETDQNGGNAIVTQWVYDSSKGKLGTLSSVVYGDSHSVSYDYDDLLRLVKTKETIKGEEFVTNYSYDGANREEFVTYPSGLTIQKSYSNSGYYNTMTNPQTEMVLWHTNAANAMGYITDYQVGNGVETHRDYDELTCLLSGIVTDFNGKHYQNLSYSFDGFGNLINRTSKVGTRISEDFTYDAFNRLVGISLNGVNTGEMVYDDYGNIISKTIDGHNVFYDAQYDGACPYEIKKMQTDSDDFAGMSQNISYTTFDKMSSVKSGSNSLSIDYGFNHERISSSEIVDGTMRQKLYAGDCEYVTDGGGRVIYTYLKGPMGVFAVCCTDDRGNSSIFYIHKDNLESWCLITDEKGDVVQRTSYDAWGNPSGDLMCDRGFTGHEHLRGFGIINMNGRAYDPFVSMMMSPDSYIQNPDFSQNYNRYAYCFNNPLSYSDPSGEWVEWFMYGIFNGAVNVIWNIQEIDSFAEGALAFGAGFIQGCLTEGLSECSWAWQVAGGVAGATVKTGVNSFVKRNTGDGLDWNVMKTDKYKDEVLYACGSNLAKSILTSYFTQPTDSEDGKNICNMLCKEKHNQILLLTASKKIMGNLFAGRKIFSGFGITKDNLEDIVPYLECALDIVSDNVTISGSSETLSKINDKLLGFDLKGVMSKFGSDADYCYSQIRALFLNN